MSPISKNRRIWAVRVAKFSFSKINWDPKNEYVFEFGSVGTTFFVILKGLVGVLVPR